MDTLLILDFSENTSSYPPLSIMLATCLWYTGFMMMMNGLIFILLQGFGYELILKFINSFLCMCEDENVHFTLDFTCEFYYVY